ncbi:hypothetical protein F5878DRAFT_625834 [Lentinula raphanica]|uniref:Uncharacterized protein n=1 Tax=Lentinula raphanica TaxID=153919 RepID=A0AA38UFH7_9AGAR|nr:hypothetical protein F5878DRAFT_625834 [Lentinula raphanica]
MVHLINVLTILLTVETSVLSVPVSVSEPDGAVVSVSEGRVVPRSNSIVPQGPAKPSVADEPYNIGAVRLKEEEIDQMKQFLEQHQSDCNIDNHESLPTLLKDLETSKGPGKEFAIIRLISAVIYCNARLPPTAQKYQLPDAALALIENRATAGTRKQKSSVSDYRFRMVNSGGVLFERVTPGQAPKFPAEGGSEVEQEEQFDLEL